MTEATSEDVLRTEVHAAWDLWPVPDPADLQTLADEWGVKVWTAFAGVPPLEVDIGSSEFLQCTPLLDLPPPAAAAYLGTYLLSFLHSATLQRNTGMFYDFTTRAHLLVCLQNENFWRTCLIPCMFPRARITVRNFVDYLIHNQEFFAVIPEDLTAMRRFALALT